LLDSVASFAEAGVVTSPIEPDFDKTGGIIPVIAQDFVTGEVLMQAWMNRDAWIETRNAGVAVYWSRSRKRLWRKGEVSGRIQRIREIFLDCDGDAVLLKVEQQGDAACHTGRRSCFYRRITDDGVDVVSEPLFDPQEVYGDEASGRSM
jgi:phosphoribosyl-AMP cyclohydrolase